MGEIIQSSYKRFVAVFSLFIVCSFQVNFLLAESFRTRKTHIAQIQATTETQKVQMGFNDVLAIKIPQDKRFLKGIELEMKIPEEMLSFPQCEAFSFYKDITPEPSEEIIDYKGNRILIDSIPSRLSMVLQIPFEEEHTIPETPYAKMLPKSVIAQDQNAFMRLQPIMKGLPENIDELIFEVNVKSILTDEGLLDLSIIYPHEEKKAVAVFIDEEPITDFSEPIFLKEGMHYLAVTSEEYRTEVRTFAIEKAKITPLEITLMDTTPIIIITAPDNAKIYLNEELVTNLENPIVVEPGEYLIRFVIGDYEITKSLSVVNGKTYNASLTVDVDLTETP